MTDVMGSDRARAASASAALTATRAGGRLQPDPGAPDGIVRRAVDGGLPG